MAKFKAQYGWCVIKLIDKEEKSAGGILLTEQDKTTSPTGVIVSSGSDAHSVGSVVAFIGARGTKRIDNVLYLFVKDEDVICEIE